MTVSLFVLLLFLLGVLVPAAYRKFTPPPTSPNQGVVIMDDFLENSLSGSLLDPYRGLYFGGDVFGSGQIQKVEYVDFPGAVNLFSSSTSPAQLTLIGDTKIKMEDSAYLELQTRYANGTTLPGGNYTLAFGVFRATSALRTDWHAVIYYNPSVSDYFICSVKGNDASGNPVTLQEVSTFKPVFSGAGNDHYLRIIVNNGQSFFYINNQLAAVIDATPVGAAIDVYSGWNLDITTGPGSLNFAVDAIIQKQEFNNPRQFV